MLPTYKPLNKLDLEEHEDTWEPRARHRSYRGFGTLALILVLVITNGATIIHFKSDKYTQDPIPIEYAKQDIISLKTTWNRFWWNTEYSPKNHSESDALWDAILPSHGFIAMDENWAFSQQWPDTMRLPSDPSKRVYLLEAYHQLHCLRIIQKTFWEAVEGREYTWKPSKHMTHCFDTLRQSVQCNSDSTPLYTFGDFTVGDGQLHKCRDWNQLRDFATENSACYKDSVDPVPLKEHFGFCDDGSDGLP